MQILQGTTHDTLRPGLIDTGTRGLYSTQVYQTQNVVNHLFKLKNLWGKNPKNIKIKLS
jgi:hypothetical protein